MCGLGQQAGTPSVQAGVGAVSGAPGSAREALGMVMAGLSWLAGADLTSAPASVQAECLREIERAHSVYTVARASVLRAFDAGGGFEDDGSRSARTWLMWQTQVTSAAATASVKWSRRLRAHPAIADSLRAGVVSASWARVICDWTDQLPADARDEADLILLAAARAGAELGDLASLAEQIRSRLAQPDADNNPGGDDGSQDRYLRVSTTLGGAGRIDGDLTPRCAAAVQAVLDALAKKHGPEDTRTAGQRRHDALEEACRRLIASQSLPDRAGQPTRIQLHIGLDDLLRRMGATDDVAADGDRPVLPWPSAMPGDECDATIIPVVTGRVDHDLLDKLTAQLKGSTPWSQRSAYDPATSEHPDQDTHRDKVRDLILANAIALLSGPDQVASVLRTGTLPPPAAAISLPLDVGTATDTIPPHLRRAVILRDQHCRGPGCQVPAAACHVHHLVPRSQGGATKLTGLILLCSFCHLILVHEWGWTITLNPDGTTTARSPDGTRVYHSHSPPATAA